MSKSRWFDLNNPNITCKHSTYRRVSGYCAPEMFCDNGGLRIHEADDLVWVRDESVRYANDMYRDVIATIPKSLLLRVYTLIQDLLNSKGLLDSTNRIKGRKKAVASGREDGYTIQGLRS